MAVATVNATRMTKAERAVAAGGLDHLVDVKVLPAMELFRFATAADPSDWAFAASWWFGKSAFGALQQWAHANGQSLSDAARTCLAVPPRNALDLLVSVRVLRPLSAWSGTPKTLRPKDARGRYGSRQEPAREITQLYIPGLDPRIWKASSLPWRDVFAGASRPLPKA